MLLSLNGQLEIKEPAPTRIKMAYFNDGCTRNRNEIVTDVSILWSVESTLPFSDVHDGQNKICDFFCKLMFVGSIG